MTPDAMLDHCLAMPGAYLDFPFDDVHATVRVKSPAMDRGMIFAEVFELRGRNTVTLRCTAEAGLAYRAMFPGVVVRGWHCPPVQQPYSNTMPLDGEVPDDVLRDMADEAYEVIVAKLPKYRRRELDALETR